MTEIEQYNDQPTVPAIPPPALTGAGMAMIREYTAAMDDAHRFATAICHSPFVPQHFAKKPADTALAILYGASVGFDPMTSVQQLYVIGGKPALYARAMVAIVLAAGHDIWTEDEGDNFVTVAGRRKGSDKITKVTWTTELAQQAGYTKNAKYKSEPRAMLYARASGDVARRIAPDALLGLAYNVEEMQLVDEQPQQRQQSTAASQKDRVRAAIQQPSPQEPEVSAENQPADEPSITDAQTKKLHALAGELGLTREQKISGACQIIGRQIESTSELTKAEAVRVIDSLENATRAAGTAAEPPQQSVPDEEGAVDGEIVDEADQVWQQCIEAASAIGMNLWGLDADFEAFSGIKRADADVAALSAYLTELQNRAAA
jgi:hypothetical protein